MITAESDSGVIDVDYDYDIDNRSLKLSPVTVLAQNTFTLTLTTEDDTLLAPDDRKMRVGRKLLYSFHLNTNIKQKLFYHLSHIQDDPVLLAAYQLSLSSGQFQALAELMTGSGVHRADKRDGTGEEIILWNNQLSNSVHQIFVIEDLNGLVDSSNGPLPKFAVLIIEEKSLSYYVGVQSDQGDPTAFHHTAPVQYLSDKWRLNINYLDSLTLQLGEV